MGKPKGPPPIGPCKLCAAVGPLTWSHILPRWTYRRITQTGDPGQPVPVQVRNAIAMLSSDQLADYLLCADCEDKFHHWETYVSTISREGTAFPALATALTRLIPGGAGAQLQAVDISELNVDAIVRFAVSVLWRAAACPRLCPELRLGPYFESFKRFLRAEAPFPLRARLLLHLINSREVPQLSQLITPPSSWKHEGHHWHSFLIFGMSFEFVVGGQDLSVFDAGCLHRTKRALVVDGHRQLRGIAYEALRAEAKGALANRR